MATKYDMVEITIENSGFKLTLDANLIAYVIDRGTHRDVVLKP